MSNKVDSIEQDRFDFYFSEKHKTHLIVCRMWDEAPYQPAYFKGQEYTEMIIAGETPVTNHFGDLLYLGSGNYSDVTFPSEECLQAITWYNQNKKQ